MAQLLYGGSFDSLAGQQRGYDELAYQIAEANRRAQQQAEAQRANYDFQNAAAQQAAMERQQSVEQAAQQNYFENVRRQQERAATEGLQQQSLGLEARKLSDVEQQQRDVEAQTKEARKEQQAGQDYSEVVKAIESGAIKDPNQIPQLFPNLNPIQLQRAHAYWQDYNAQLQQQYQAQLSGAGMMNADLAARRKAAVTGVGQPPMIFGRADYEKRLAAAQQPYDEAGVAPIVENPRFAKIAPTVNFDPAAQRFVPNMPAPYQFQPRQTSMTVAPPVAPAAQPPQQFTPGQRVRQDGVVYEFDGKNWNPVE